MTIDAKLIFAILGPLFFVLGSLRCATARSFDVQGRAWIIIGVVFSAVAWCLWR